MRSTACGSSSSRSGCSCPVAGALLADWGADVVRIERPEGDPYRGLVTQGIGADSGGVNLSMALANRGKRSVALDLRHEQGTAVLHRLLETADVFLTSLRPGALDASDSTPRRCASATRGWSTPAATATASGAPTPTSPGYDASAFWARGGLAHILTPPERDYPISQRGAMGDRNGAMALAFGIAGALLERDTHRRRLGRRRVAARRPRCGRCRRTCSRCSRAASRRGDRAGGMRRTRSSAVPHQGRPPHLSSCSSRPTATGPTSAGSRSRADLVDDPRFADLAARRDTPTSASPSSTREFGRRTLRRVEGAARGARRAVGAGAGGRGAARRSRR